MALFFFRLPKPRKFRYRPVLYNEAADKERDGGHLSGNEEEIINPQFREEIQRRWRRKDAVKMKSRGLSALIVTLIMLLVLLYIIFIKL